MISVLNRHSRVCITGLHGIFQLTILMTSLFCSRTEDSVALHAMNKKVEPYEKSNGFIVIPDR